MRSRLSKFLVFIFIIFVIQILPPILIAKYLYPRNEITIYNGDALETPLRVSDFFKQEPSLKNFVGEIFSSPLNLDWYEVRLYNRTKYENPFTYCIQGQMGPATTIFTFKEGDPRQHKTDFIDDDIKTFVTKHPDYQINAGDSNYFIAQSTENYVISVSWSGEGPDDCKLFIPRAEQGYPHIEVVYEVTIKPYSTAWYARLIIIFIAWLFIISSLVSIISITRRLSDRTGNKLFNEQNPK